MSGDGDEAIHEQVWRAVDGDGTMREFLESVERDDGLLTALLGGTHGSSQATQLAGDARRLVNVTSLAHTHLVPLGWAPTVMPTELLSQACETVASGDPGGADVLLADWWDSETGRIIMSGTVSKFADMGGGEPDYHALFQARGRLIDLARQHHEAQRYDASVLMLLAQIEGLVMDVAGGSKFFTKGTQKAPLIDSSQLVSIPAGLDALHAVYGSNVGATQMEGSLSRHGVLHGRELAFDTRVNSAKTWSLLVAVVEWAQPLARATADEMRREREAANAGSELVDERGRRIDRREFTETKACLSLCCTSALNRQQRQGTFRDDIVGGVYGPGDFARRGLPTPEHGIVQEVSDDGLTAMFWRRTVSGWHLGRAIVVQPDGGYDERTYGGAEAPMLPGEGAARGWSGPWGHTPDWA